MTIRFLQRWRGCREGDVKEWSDGAGNLLVARGIAVEVPDTPKDKTRRGGLARTKTR